MSNNEQELIRIVKQNPFNDVRKAWGRQLKNLQNADFDMLSRYQYVLPCDRDNPRFVDAVNRGREQNKSGRLRTELFPLPFCGNPRANIWYVQINPRGSEVDYYEFSSISSSVKRTIQNRLAASVGGCPNSFEFLQNGDEERLALEERQRLLINQLDLSRAHHDFYPLTMAFRTFRNNYNRKRIGSYNWWRNALCVNNRNALFGDVFANYAEEQWASELGARLFVIEYYPYASENPTWNKLYDVNHPYHSFFVSMLKYANDNGKYVVFRTKRQYEWAGLAEIVSHPYFLANYRNVSLTKKNVIGLQL